MTSGIINYLSILRYCQKGLFNRKAFFVSVLFLVFSSLLFSQEEIFLNLQSSTLEGDKKVIIESELFYLLKEGKLISHYTRPKEYFVITSDFGEAQMYQPSTNTVMVQYGENLKASTSLIYLFLGHDEIDLGLSESGFQLKTSYYEQQYMVTEWIPPTKLLEVITEVKMVYDNGYPIYCEYAKDDRVITKIYFSEYLPIAKSKLPQRVTTINFSSENDSTINRVLLSNIQSGSNLSSELRDFKIPADAKLVD